MKSRKYSDNSIDHTRTSNPCTCESSNLPSIEDFPFDKIELMFIDLVRCIGTGYASGEIVGWQHAMNVAEDRVGPIDGPTFFGRILSLMRALQFERHTGFCFMAPGCSKISNDELSLVQIVQAARSGSDHKLNGALLTFTTTPQPARTALAAKALAGLCAWYDDASKSNFSHHSQHPHRVIH